jgi:hypothetical protein
MKESIVLLAMCFTIGLLITSASAIPTHVENASVYMQNAQACSNDTTSLLGNTSCTYEQNLAIYELLLQVIEDSSTQQVQTMLPNVTYVNTTIENTTVIYVTPEPTVIQTESDQSRDHPSVQSGQ